MWHDDSMSCCEHCCVNNRAGDYHTTTRAWQCSWGSNYDHNFYPGHFQHCDYRTSFRSGTGTSTTNINIKKS